MKKLLFVALAAVGMTACVQNEELAVAQPNAKIEFANSYVSNASRANENPVITTANLAGFDVWAFMDETAGNVLTDEDVVRSGDAWGYTNIQYWFPEHTYYFAALAPMNSANITSKTLATGEAAKLGLGEISFTNANATDDRLNGTEDLLYAKEKVTTPNISKLTNEGMAAVKMQFQHLLSKVRFTFENGFKVPGQKIVVTNVTMTAPKTGTINLAQTAYNEDWVLGSETLTLKFGDVAELDATEIGVAANERFSIPATDAYQYNVEFDLAVYQNSLLANEYHKVAVIEGYPLEMGKAYNLKAVIDENALSLHKIEFKAEVDEWVDANNTEIEIPVGYYIDSVGNYVATTESGLQAIAEGINAGELPADTKIVLGDDIDLSNMRSLVSNWTPIGSPDAPFTGVLDGNGHKISNLTLVEEEAKEGKAHIGFISYAKDATIKNVVFENVDINIPCLDIDHSQGHIGAVVGTLEGTSTIEDVTVKGDIKVEATTTANGASRVAAVVGGNSYANVTIKNVHVIANEGSYVKANNNTGAIAGQLQGKTVYENCSSNIDVTVNKFFAGGIVGLAGTNDKFINCHTTGNIAVLAGREGRHNDEYRVGGIAGGWSDGKKNVLTLVNCSYTGNISGKNSDGTVADPLDYMGYVGRGYTLTNCAGSKVIIDGTEFVQKYDNVYGVYTINGCTPVATADELVAALEANEGVYFLNDIKIDPASMSNAYGATGINVLNGQTIDGGGHSISVNAWGTWDSAISTTGGVIKNIKVTGGMRGIFVNHNSTHSEKVVLQNVTIDGTVYTISCDQGTKQGLDAYSCVINGWTSYADTIGDVYFENCSFGAGQGYKFCRPYAPTTFVGCNFCKGYEIDARAAVVLKNCTVNGEPVTSANLATLVTGNVANATVK
ncbi:MAG: fimbrillin family protein [Alistipes sp.]|nr:fimbrillin family protein [Alistipes sp.]